MKRTIMIPQEQLLHIAPDITIAHAAVFDYIVGICTSPSTKLKKKEVDGIKYVWVHFGTMRERMPILGIKSKARFSQITTDLEKWQLVKSIKKIGGKHHNMTFFTLGEAVDALNWSDDDVLNPFNTPVKSIKHPLLNTLNTDIDNNKNNIPSTIDPAAPSATGSAEEEHSETEYEPAMKPKFSMDGNADLHQERKPPTRKMLTDPKYLETLALYQQRVFKNCTARTQSIYEGIPRAEKIFAQYFGDMGHQLLLKAIDTLPKSEVFKWMLDKTPTANAPKKVFSQTFIENHLVALVTSTKTEEYEPTNPHLVKRAATEEERRKIQEANKERVRKFMEQLKGGKA